jgi:hypothetical protein
VERLTTDDAEAVIFVDLTGEAADFYIAPADWVGTTRHGRPVSAARDRATRTVTTMPYALTGSSHGIDDGMSWPAGRDERQDVPPGRSAAQRPER